MKERLDVLLVEKGLAESRNKAQIMLMEGLVTVDGVLEDKPGSRFAEDVTIEVKDVGRKYVSRGGKKLEKAIAEFEPDLKDAICMDIGASTGGFTDCMLQNDAAHVYAVDVGYGQLDYKLRTDSRVTCMEKTNIRYVTTEDVADIIDFASVDVSFISLKLVLPVAKTLLSKHGQMVCLIKPQFEAGKEQVGKKGVVRDAKVHKAVIEEIGAFALNEGFFISGLTFSPIKGPEGNIEYLLYLTCDKCDKDSKNKNVLLEDLPAQAASIVAKAHEEL